MNDQYELVSKKELKESNIIVDLFIGKLIKNIKKETEGKIIISHNPKENLFVGSYRYGLVTRKKNEHYDYDVNLDIQINNEIELKQVENKLSNCIRTISSKKHKNISFEYEWTKKTIKINVKKCNKKVFSIDLMLFKKVDSETQKEYLTKENGVLQFKLARLDNKTGSYKEHALKIEKIKKNGHWEKVRKEYLKRKNENKDDKKSYELRMESVNFIYDNFCK